MNGLCALSITVLVSCTCVVSFTPGLAPAGDTHRNSIYHNIPVMASHSSSRQDQLPQHGRAAGPGSLWTRRRRSRLTARLSPTETGVPEAAAVPRDVTLADESIAAAGAGKDDGVGGTSPYRSSSSKNLTERGGLLLLSTVPLVWGTYAPSVKYLYQMGDSPPGLLFNFACYVVSVLTFTAVASFNIRPRTTVEGEGAKPPKEEILRHRYAMQAGTELGLWLFLAGTVQVWGLELTSASRAGFLVQLTTVIVPVLEAVLGRRKLKPQVWFACALAMVGVALVSLGGSLPPGVDVVKFVTGSISTARLAVPSGLWESIANGNFRGDLLVSCSALFYSLHVVRLGVHVSKVDTLSLARAKALAELGFSALSLVVAALIGGQGGNFARFVSALASKPELLAVFGAVVVWNGALTTAYAMWAQTRGQAAVAPSEANLVYSLQPLWSVLFAVVLLKESFRGVEAVGAALLLLSLFLVASQSDGGPPPSSDGGVGGEVTTADQDDSEAQGKAK